MLNFIKENNIKLVLDIHGCNNFHNFDFCLGTNNRKNLKGQYNILEVLSNGLNLIGKVAIDEYFKASLDGNVSKFISDNSNIPSIQIEISSRFRKDEKYLEQLVSCLEITIENINKRCLTIKEQLER